MNCISSSDACFYGGLVGLKFGVYKTLYIHKNIKVKKEINASNGKQNVYFLAKMGLYYASKGWSLVSFRNLF